ncbi:MAG: hydroxymethylglutaryl-CoA reductase, partial [Woeseiaceae bacterium]|nr:hydroxymethylglutaryl-CoA reductase [Woeseiaceae bacterium]
KKYSKSLPIIIAMSNSSSKTSDLVASVADARNKNKEIYEKIFEQMGEISQQGFDAIKKKDFNQLGDLMNIYQGLLNSIGVSTPELESMIDIARSSGALGAKLTGSGGGGSIIALCPDHQKEVINSLNGAGYQTIPIDADNN